MKKSILVMFITGGCLAATAQTPDTTRQQQLNTPYPPDSTVITPQVAPVEATPPASTMPADTMNSMPPAHPVNTDVRSNEPMADTVSMKTTTSQPSVTETNANTAVMATGDTIQVAAPLMSTSRETMPAQQNMTTEQSAGATYNMPRGVNNPESAVLLTGLSKWSALPILNTYVPQEVVDKLKMEHGDKLYDITMLKTGENQYSYSARVQDNGVYRSVIINDNATAVTQ